MLNFFRRLFSKSIDSIVADITNKIEHLHIVAEAHAVEQKVQQKAIADAITARDFAEREYNRAKTIAEKLTSLISAA